MREIIPTDNITAKIIGQAIEVHRQMGPGLLESSYLTCLAYELEQSGLYVQQQVALPLIYKEIKMECGYRLDLLVENKVVVEIKSVDNINEVHVAQVLTYLKLTKAPVGLLINFNVTRLTSGIKRLILKDKISS